MHVDGTYVANHHGQLWDRTTTNKVFPMHTPSILHGSLVGAHKGQMSFGQLYTRNEQ
jgi:hypothetical protein